MTPREPRRGDFSQVARQIVQEATAPHDEDPQHAESEELKDRPKRADSPSDQRKDPAA